jgi:hypothetical protein
MNTKRISFVLAGLAVVMAVAPVFVGDAAAIPAFARKYRQSCSTCHVAAPKLKPYGEEFAANGFVLPDGEEPRRSTLDTGDERLLLQTDLPLAVRFDAYLRASEQAGPDTDLQAPYGLKLLSGGRVTRNVSYYFYFYAYERGEVAGLEDAYLHFNHLRGSELDVIIGQFQVSDPLFKRELRLTFEDYQVYRYRPGESQANLTYDRGLMLTYGLDFGMDLVGQVLNGNGIPAADDREFDVDSDKAVSLRLSQVLGMVRVGAFGYYNKERNELGVSNEIYYAGGDATLGNDLMELNLQYLHREDSNVMFVAPDSTDTTVDGGFAELVVLPGGDRSRWAFVGLYNVIESDEAGGDVDRGTLAANYYMARNLRILFETTRDFENEAWEFTLGAMGAF